MVSGRVTRSSSTAKIRKCRKSLADKKDTSNQQKKKQKKPVSTKKQNGKQKKEPAKRKKDEGKKYVFVFATSLFLFSLALFCQIYSSRYRH